MAWSELDEQRLRRIHRTATPCKNSEEFFRKLSELFKTKSAGSIREKCRRMGLEEKVEKPQDDRILCCFCELPIEKWQKATKNMHRNCYTKKWRIDNL